MILSPAPSRCPPAQAPVKCLIVDDLDENLLAMGALLRSDDVQVLTARSGVEALEHLLVHDVALALLDVQMPDMDGFELAELIRGSERTRQVPLIFVTAGNRDPVRLFKGYDSGAVDFLYKPVDPRILRHKAAVFFQLFRQKQQLAHQLQVSTETLRLNEMFMAVLGHDLRNPLSAMVNAAQLLQRQAPDDKVRDSAERMLASGRRMARMVDDLLDLARARLGNGLALRCASTDLAALMQRVVQEQHAASGRRIDIEQGGDLLGTWDADRLAQVASNLIGNACRHGDSDAPVTVQLDGSEADHVMLRVRNSGRIAPELLPHLFDPFRGGTAAAHRSDGLGLGLFIVQQIVQAHGGTVCATSAAGTTEFTVSVPRHAPPDPAA